MFKIETLDGLEVYVYTILATDEMMGDCIIDTGAYLQGYMEEASTLDPAEGK